MKKNVLLSKYPIIIFAEENFSAFQLEILSHFEM